MRTKCQGSLAALSEPLQRGLGIFRRVGDLNAARPSASAVALVHDWLVAHRGGEQVLLELARLFPGAPIYTLVCDPRAIHPELHQHPIQTSFIQRLPGAPRRFRQYLPLFPRAIESFDLSQHQLVLSTSHCVAKGVRPARHQVHISYVHTPMRYIWDQMEHYLARVPAPTRPLARRGAMALRRWDVRSGARPDVLVANSEYVAARIRRVWGREEVQVLHPPVDVAFFHAAPPQVRAGFLVVSALVPYKRVELAVQWASADGEQLTVIGEGPELERLRRMAGPTVRFRQGLERAALRQAYASAEALLFCGVEDFGIVPVEAMAAGCPVIAFGEGGACETVCDTDDIARATGVFFHAPEPAALRTAVAKFRRARSKGAYAPQVLQKHAETFSAAVFLDGFKRILGARLGQSASQFLRTD